MPLIAQRSGTLRDALLLQAGAALMLLAGCAAQGARPGIATGPASSAHSARPVAMRQYRLPMGDISSGGNIIERRLPAYPESLLAACPVSVEVQIRVDVNRAGQVENVLGGLVDDAGLTSRWQQYFLAARAAAMQWRFNPLRVTHWAADVDGNSHVVDSAIQPFKRLYAIRFGCSAGKPVISVAEVGARQG